MALALTGHLSPLNVMIIVTIMGLIRPSDLGVRGALLADIMPAEQLVGAISVVAHDAGQRAHRRRADRHRSVRGRSASATSMWRSPVSILRPRF